MKLDHLNEDAREYYESDDGGYYELMLPYFWNDKPKPGVPPHLTVDVVFPESFREAYSDVLSNPDDEDVLQKEVSRRLESWVRKGYVCGASDTRIDGVDDLRDALDNDKLTLILG